MLIEHAWLLVFCVAALLLGLGATSSLINARPWASEPLACAAVGVLVGPLGLGLLHADVNTDEVANTLVREVSRITLAVSVTAAAMRLPRSWFFRYRRALAVALGPGLLGMWAMGTLVIWCVLPVGLPLALLLAAILTPTDPVLSAPIITGQAAQRLVPHDLRHGITAESGANDGLALPIVMGVVLFTQQPPGEAAWSWIVHTILGDICVDVAVGLVIGWSAQRAMSWAERHRKAESTSLVTLALALSVASLAASRLLGASGVLAAFIAGVMFNQGLHGEQEQRQERFNEALTRFFELPIFVLLAAAFPWSRWMEMGWRGLAFAVLLLFLRRLPVWLLLHRAMPWTRRTPGALFAGWFGPVGIGAVFYTCEMQARPEFNDLWPAVSLAVAVSMVAHAISASPLTTLLGRSLGRQEEPPPHLPGGVAAGIHAAHGTAPAPARKEDQ